MSFLFTLKLSYSKPFHNTLNYASTANIEEVMKFYNLGHKTFETDFSDCFLKGCSFLVKPSLGLVLKSSFCNFKCLNDRLRYWSV